MKKREFEHLDGLVCKIRFGSPSQLKLEIVNNRAGPPFRSRVYEPEAGKTITLNEIPLTFLMIDEKPDGKVDGDRVVYNKRLYFQIDCREEMRVVDAYHLIAALRRNEKSYFSRLPKEMIRLIQAFLFY
jgi:hypothetical protein